MSVVLQALSAGREWQLLEPQLLTNKGYKLLHCCHMAMEQLQKILCLHHPSIIISSSSSDTRSTSSSDGKQGGSTDDTPAAVVAVYGLEAPVRRYIASMCDGRLVPTTWLNEVSHTTWAAHTLKQYRTPVLTHSCCRQLTYACSAQL
jgi:hypothetical protein